MCLKIAELRQADKRYQVGDQIITALEPATVSINKGQLCLIIGPSGSGKTTLLSLLGCVIYPTSGELFLRGQKINGLPESALAALRLNHIGFVFQNFNLIAPLNAEENVAMPLKLQGIDHKEIQQRVEQALKLVGMLDRRRNLPGQLSGGQQQRIAIARALVTQPEMILCDEPTAALDSQSLELVMKELRLLADQGKAVIVVTHDPRLSRYADRILEVNNGIVTETKQPS